MGNTDLRHRLMAILAADVAGYSRLMADDECATISGLDAARDVFRQHVSHRRGRIVDTAGDSVLAVFDTASGAVEAALAIQRELGAALVDTRDDRRMRFRMSVHLGDVVEKPDGSVYGNGVNVAARLQALAAPGGISVSEAVRSTLGERPGRVFDDQGLHGVKNIAEPVHAYRLSSTPAAKAGDIVDTGLHASAPTDLSAPVPSLAEQPLTPNNLPLNAPALIGREAELATVIALLAGTHLLTLVGAGGVGKTRFALEVADDVRGDYRDGVWLVELAPVGDPALVLQTVAGVLDIHEEPGRALLDTLLDFLRHREMLIVLDNCEHVVEACAQFAAKVLRTSAGTRILATSREALSVSGETAWPTPSLRTAVPNDMGSPEQLLKYPATRLFVQRAIAASPTFRLLPENATAVAIICHRLDGIPLALELAAARVNAIRVEQLAERLSDRFTLLTRGSRTVLPRHQTLRSLIDWSYDLLTEAECLLLRRLSVFARGWTVESAEAVCSGDGLSPESVLDLLSNLVGKSLVVLDHRSNEPRYRMLETIRQYGFEKLIKAGESDAIHARHLDHFVDFAESVRPKLQQHGQMRWLARVDDEVDNIRVALDWSEKPAAAELGLRLISALFRYWGGGADAKEIVDRVGRLALCSGTPQTVHQARAFYVAAALATTFDPPRGRRLAEECLTTSRALDFSEGVAQALLWLANLDSNKRDPSTAELFSESLRIGNCIGDPWRKAALRTLCLWRYAAYELVMGHYESVEALLRDYKLEIVTIGYDSLLMGYSRALLGRVAAERGDFERSSRLLVESLALYRAVDSKFDIASTLSEQGFLALRLGNSALALEHLRESLSLHCNYPMSPWVTKGLASLQIAYAACGRWQIAARLTGVLGCAEGVNTAAPPLSDRFAREAKEAVARTRAELGDAAFNDESDAGRLMTRAQAIKFALAG